MKKIRMNGIGRTFYYWSWISARLIGMSLAFVLAFSLFYGFLDEGVHEVLRLANSYLLMFGMIMPMALQMSAVQIYLPQCLSMGSRRRDACIGLCWANLIFSALMYLIAFVFQRTVGAVSGFSDWSMDTEEPVTLLAYACGAILIGGIGALLGMICVRFGKAGMVAFILMCCIAGSLGAMMVVGSGSSELSSLIWGHPAVSVAVSLLVYAVCAVVEYRMIRKYEVHA